MDMFIYFIIVSMPAIYIVYGYKQKRKQDAERATFFGEHKGWVIYLSPRNRGVLALNHELKKVVVGSITKYVECYWSDLNAVEIEKNGQSILQTNRGSQVMGAAVGAVLLGPLGLLVGGISGSKRKKNYINELSLNILVDHPSAPVHRIAFFHSPGSGVSTSSVKLKEPARLMEHFHALLSNAVRSDHRETFALQPQLATSGNPEHRIAKLWELHQAGAITESEFTSQKLAILEPSSSLLDHSHFRKCA